MSSLPTSQQPPTRPRGKGKSADARPLDQLLDYTLYICIFEQDVSTPSSFHWGMYLHQNPNKGGTAFDAKGSPGRWMAVQKATRGATGSQLLVGLVRIANIDPDKLDKVKQIITEEDSMVNEIKDFRCRMYVERACQRLKDKGLMNFESWAVLLKELETFGNNHLRSCEQNAQPRPIGCSRVCHLNATSHEEQL